MYTLDTNAIIYYLKDESAAVTVLRELFAQHFTIYVSAVTELELFGYPGLSSGEFLQIDGLLKTLSVIPMDSRLARIAGSLRRTYRTSVTDSIIAATALFTGSKLITRNVNDFKKISGLSLQRI